MSSNNIKNNKNGEKGKKARHAHVNRSNNMGNGGKANTNHPVIPAAAGGRDRKESEMSEAEEGTMCQVCMNTIKVWSVGECNHVICMICSTRMRVLCQRNECAICRQDMPKVIFTTALQKYENIKDNIYPMDRKYKICFETEEIQNNYMELLEHQCPHCPEKVTFKTFQQLDKHMRREHEMYYCDLCVTELKIFTGERKSYNRKDLVRHRREGDPDDSSFKGHPLCEFCDERFFDSEALFKHLRKDHYFCHFCDADGFQYFYADYADLRGHFDRDHFLCKEPQCEEKKFVVFRTELDLKAHRLDQHGGLMTKAASKEARKVELNFNFGDRRDRDDDRGGGRGRDRGGGGRGGRDRRDRDREDAHTAAPEYHDQLDGPVRGAAAVPEQTPDLVSDFPSLSGAPAKVKAPANKEQPQSWSNRSGAATATAEEFPSLPGSRPVTSSSGPVKPYKKPEPKNKTQSAASMNTPRTEDFPSLPVSAPSSRNTSKPSKPATVIKTPFNKKPSPAPQPQVRPSPTKSTATMGKARASFDDDSDDDYPSLGGGPSLNLNYSSNKTVAKSGQDLGYTSASVSSNIRTVDRSVLEAMNAPKTNNSSKPSVSSTSDFPGLGRPQQTLDFTTAKKGKKNRKGNQNNNDLSYASKSKEDNKDDRSGKSLNSICDFLGGGASVKVTESKPKPKKEAEVKPIVSKPADEEVYRPSKNKTTINNNLEQSKPAQKADENNGGEDFPSLGKAAKKLTRNFVSAEEKLVQQKSVFTKWGKTVSQAEQGNPGTQKNKVNGKKSKSSQNHKYIAPTNFNERNSGLIVSITDLIGIKSLEFKQFKDISGKYRNGQLDFDVYYVQCRELLEEKNFRKVFPELLALLPDIEKQQQLYQLYKQDQWFDNDCVSDCDNCRQICLKKDLDSHLKGCQEEEFPSLW